MKKNFTALCALTVFFLSFNFSNSTNLYAQDSSVSYLALGDSYTIGESVDAHERWPVQLTERLRNTGINISEPHIIAKTGWTTDELIDSLNHTNVSTDYELVSLLIGVNNQYRGYDINQYEEEFTLLLEKAFKYAGGDSSKVFVVSIPDYGVTPFGQKRNPDKIAAELDEYNSMAKNICKKSGISFINITGISIGALNDKSLIAGDKLHPSGKMYSLWVKEIFPVVQEIIRP